MHEEVIIEPAYMLTTVDNPYNPFTQWEQWYWFDEHKGYHTCEYLARVAVTSNAFTPMEEQREQNRAINSIVRNDPLNIYRKVTADSFEELLKEGSDNKKTFKDFSVENSIVDTPSPIKDE